jgi:hypothetical protein
MPSTTWCVGATDSHRGDGVLKEATVARKALDAYLMISAEGGSVTISGAATPR